MELTPEKIIIIIITTTSSSSSLLLISYIIIITIIVINNNTTSTMTTSASLTCTSLAVGEQLEALLTAARVASRQVLTAGHTATIVVPALVLVRARRLHHVRLVARLADAVVAAVEVLAVAVRADATIRATLVHV